MKALALFLSMMISSIAFGASEQTGEQNICTPCPSGHCKPNPACPTNGPRVHGKDVKPVKKPSDKDAKSEGSVQ